MFKVENTGTIAWKKIIDENGEYIASLDELFNGDWGIYAKKTGKRLTPEAFSNPSKAATWLWKNRKDLGEPFSLYKDDDGRKRK